MTITIVFFLLLAGVCFVLGYIVARADLAADRDCLRQQREELEAAWRALDQTRQVRAVFRTARRAMQNEAMRAVQTQPRPARRDNADLRTDGER